MFDFILKGVNKEIAVLASDECEYSVTSMVILDANSAAVASVVCCMAKTEDHTRLGGFVFDQHGRFVQIDGLSLK